MPGDRDNPGIAPDALARAEAALTRLSDDYLAWAEADANAMRGCLAEIQSHPTDLADALWRLFRIAHDMKGQATTFGYPLVTEIGTRLCRLIEAAPDPGPDHLHAIALHVAAMAEVVEGRLSGDGGEAGRLVLACLE